MASAGLPTTTPAQIDPARPGRALPDVGHAASKPPKSHLHHHDDVWNADSTFALLQAWGGRFLELNQGCLSRADWSYVTQQVLLLSGKTSFTETQCRNRIDTLKKKYKREKHKLATMGGGFSSWPYYQHLDSFLKPAPLRIQPLVALPAADCTGKMNPPPVAALTAEYVEKTDPQPAATPATECVGKMDPCLEKGRLVGPIALNNAFLGETAHLGQENQEHDAANIVSASCELPDSSEMSQSSFKSSDNEQKDRRKGKRQRRTGDACFGVIAKALTKFVDVYERIETAKHEQALDLEKTRMEVTRNFELQKWRLLMQMQMELVKIKGGTDDGDQFVDDIGANLFATCFMPLDYCG